MLAVVFLFALPCVMCWTICWYVIEKRFGQGLSTPFDVGLCVGLAGFSVFPVLNFVLALFVGSYVLWWARQNP